MNAYSIPAAITPTTTTFTLEQRETRESVITLFYPLRYIYTMVNNLIYYIRQKSQCQYHLYLDFHFL